MDTNKDKEINKNITDLANDVALERKKLTDKSKDGFNFVGTLENWTTADEQEAKVKEIEKVTSDQTLQVKAIADDHKREKGTKKS